MASKLKWWPVWDALLPRNTRSPALPTQPLPRPRNVWEAVLATALASYWSSSLTKRLVNVIKIRLKAKSWDFDGCFFFTVCAGNESQEGAWVRNCSILPALSLGTRACLITAVPHPHTDTERNRKYAGAASLRANFSAMCCCDAAEMRIWRWLTLQDGWTRLRSLRPPPRAFTP